MRSPQHHKFDTRIATCSHLVPRTSRVGASYLTSQGFSQIPAFLSCQGRPDPRLDEPARNCSSHCLPACQYIGLRSGSYVMAVMSPQQLCSPGPGSLCHLRGPDPCFCPRTLPTQLGKSATKTRTLVQTAKPIGKNATIIQLQTGRNRGWVMFGSRTVRGAGRRPRYVGDSAPMVSYAAGKKIPA